MAEDYLDVLNGPQREAVLDSEHTLLVLAGAGSGKTRVITTKIVHAIRDLGIKPYQILAVTFTNKAAKEMKGRVETMLGEDYNLSGLEIKTFHSYGAGLLRKNAFLIGYPSSFNIYDDSDSLALMANLFPNEGRNNLRDYCKKISLAKDRGLGPDDNDRYLDIISAQLEGFRFHYSSYEKALRDSGCMDFADLIMKANELLEANPEVREQLHRRYRLILVDEYQDSNGSQFKLLRNIVGEHTQLVVVGDDDQSIYRFRGAEIGNILNFAKQYGNVRTIKLEENYRSTKSIISLASNLIAHNRGRHEKTLFTNNEEGRKPRVLNCYSEDDEALTIASMIERTLGEKDTAILFRTNAQSRAFETTFSRMRMRYQLVGALRFYEREEIKDLLATFSLVLNPRDQVSFARIINKPARGIGATSVKRIVDAGQDTIDTMENMLTAGLFSGRTKSGVQEFLAAYHGAVDLLDGEGETLADVATYCASRFGFKEHYESDPDPTVAKSKIENINALVTAMQSFAHSREGLALFLESITLDNSALPGNEEGGKISSEKDVVKLITMHNTKGLEFDTVYVTGLEDDIIPGNRSDTSDADIEEERRIFYVAVTRARKELYLTWASVRHMWGQTMYQRPSSFFRDIPETCYEGQLTKSGGVESSRSSYTNRYSYEPRYAPKTEAPNVFHEPPVKKVEKVENKTVFALGDTVLSPDYGRGKIVNVDKRNDKTIIRIEFENGRKCIFNTKYCNLKKV